jgi:putative aldouronate transport system substrate-binding protein
MAGCLLVMGAALSFAGGRRAGSAEAVPLPPNDGPLTPYSSPVTVRVGYAMDSNFTFREGDNVDNNPWTRLYKDALNIEMKSMWNIDSSQATTRMNTAIASGDYPDILVINPLEYVRYAESGLIADVTGLYDKYLTDHARELLNCDDGYALNAAQLNGGRIYGIPWIASAYDAVKVLWFRQDWLDNLNLPVPRTIDDFIRTAEAFTKNDPDRNGRNDTYALAIDGSTLGTWRFDLEGIFEMFGAYPQPERFANNLGLVDDGTGTLRWGGETARMKDALALLQNFYRNGYIAQDFATHDASRAEADFVTGKAGMFFGAMHGGLAIGNSFQSNRYTGILPQSADLNAAPLPGTGGYANAFQVSSYYSNFTISSKHKNPEALFKMFNLAVETVGYGNDPEQFTRYYGNNDNYWSLAVVIGNDPLANYTGYQNVTEALATGNRNKLNMVERTNAEQIVNDYLNVSTVTEANLPQYGSAWGMWSVFADPDGGYAAVDKAIKAGALQPAGYGTAATELMSSRTASLMDLTTTSIIKIIYGEESPAYWDTVVANWHQIGGDEVLVDANRWYKSK